MLKTLFGKGNDAGAKSAAARPAQASLDIARINTLIEFFPIGKKLRYYPEFNKEIELDTLVVAYCVNGLFVYSLEAIERDGEGSPKSFRSGESETRVPASGVKQFQLLVPDTSALEMKLDYYRRAQIGRGRQFNKGNSITLISNAGVKGVSTVDTEVAKQVILREGPYAQMKMILLTPELGTLSVSDQRKKTRTRINVPATVSLSSGRNSWPCTLVDISDAEFRIRWRDSGAALPGMQKGDALLVDIRLAESERQYAVKGTVIRHSAETCVIQLDGQVVGGRLEAFSPLDLLELKAGLLNAGK